ncbi:uncharacterized protein LOC143840563 [Paroedura picta]|uniref:uncharacterized protein LOC143840563 n=1 Tax=Paroedura picta TaxID=143630 RepID=UPI00405798CE
MTGVGGRGREGKKERKKAKGGGTKDGAPSPLKLQQQQLKGGLEPQSPLGAAAAAAAAAPAASSPQLSALIAAAAAAAPPLPPPPLPGAPSADGWPSPPAPQRTRPSRSPSRSARQATGRPEPGAQRRLLTGTPRPPPPRPPLQPPLVIFPSNQHGVRAELRKGDTMLISLRTALPYNMSFQLPVRRDTST